jgi:hypothetical protein
MKRLEIEMKNKKLAYTQLSQSLDIKGDSEALNTIRNENHSMLTKP